MMIQINTDANIHGTTALASQISASVEQALDHLKEHITRVEVHLSDESRGKSGPHDQRCMLEARISGLKPMAVTDQASTLEQAVNGATEKLARAIETTLGRLHDRGRKKGALPLADSDVETE